MDPVSTGCGEVTAGVGGGRAPLPSFCLLPWQARAAPERLGCPPPLPGRRPRPHHPHRPGTFLTHPPPAPAQGGRTLPPPPPPGPGRAHTHTPPPTHHPRRPRQASPRRSRQAARRVTPLLPSPPVPAAVAAGGRHELGAWPLAGAAAPAPAGPPAVAGAAAGPGGRGGGGRGGHPLLCQQGQPAGVERQPVHGERPRAAVGEGAAAQPAGLRAAALVRAQGGNRDRPAAGSDFLRSERGAAGRGPRERRSPAAAGGAVRAGARPRCRCCRAVAAVALRAASPPAALARRRQPCRYRVRCWP